MRLKNILLFSLLTVLSLSLRSLTAKADHFAAADLYLTYIGAGIDGCTGTAEYKYEIVFDEYRPCDPGNAPLGMTETITYSSATAGFTNTINLIDVEIDTLDQLCDTFKSQNSCRIPIATQPLGFIRHRFRGTLTLPSAQSDWIFVWTSCCTTVPLLNVPNFQPIYVECMLNNVVKYNNSTPRFLIDPLPYLCTNQPATFLNGPFDVNGDSLETIGTGHYVDPTNTLPYLPGYSLANPIAASAANPYVLNKFTGTATFTPTLQGRFTLNFQCDEYDRKTGIRTAYIRRDVEANVINCTSPPPTIDTLPPLVGGGKIVKGKTLIACPGNNVTFDINGQAINALSEVYMEASLGAVPGATFTVAGAGTQKPVGTFSWTPTNNDYGEHTVIITSKDSTCNGTGTLIVQKNYTVILIKVIPGLDAGPDQPICHLNPSPKQLFVKGAEDLTNILWQDISGGPAKNLSADNIVNPIANPNVTTTYVVSSSDLVDKCRIRDTVVLYEDKTNTMDIFPQTDKFVMCRPGYLQLDAMVTGRGPVNNTTCGVLGKPVSGVYDSVTTYGSSLYGSGFSYDTIGTASPILYNNIKTTKHQFLVTREDLKEYGMYPGSIQALMFETAGSTTPDNFEYANFSISLKCTNKTVLSKAEGFETGMVPVYTAPGMVNFPNGKHKFTFNAPYDWDTTKNLIIELCYSDNPAVVGACLPANGEPPIIRYMPTLYASSLEMKAANATVVSVCGTTTSPNIKEGFGRPVFQFDYVETPALPFIYNWSPGQYLSDSTIKQPLAYAPNTTSYSVRSKGRSGCLFADTLQVYVPVHDFSVLPKDTAICFGEGAPLNILKGTYYQWYEFENGEYKPAVKSLSCDNCANPVASPEKTTHYKIMVGDDVFCYDTIDAYVEVRPLPNVNILTPDTTIKYGQSVQLLVNGARLYNWSPVSSLNNPNVSYPIATPTEPTMYVVTGLGTNGCRSFDTVRVNIDYRDKLFIPTAFSPNGDGKNDNFRIPNLTFQRIVEFRVFNRWGQEIFSGGDPKKGWDGTWKGVSQEIGTYQYMIRVAYPDGYVETYKGDVALVK